MSKKNAQLVGQMSLFDETGQMITFVSTHSKESTKKEPLKEVPKTSKKCSNERLQELFQKAIQMVKDEDFPLEEINPIVEVKNYTRAWGQCSHRRRNGVMTNSISVSETLLLASEHDIMTTLLHEVLHATDGCHNHGSIWKYRASVINKKYGYNIKRTTSATEKDLDMDEYFKRYRYVFQCTKCGNKFGYMKAGRVVKGIEQNRCWCKCGGKFEKVV